MTIVTIGLLTSACERLNRPGPGPPPRLPVPNTPHPLRRAGCSRSQSSERSRHGRLHRAPPGGRTWSDAMRARSHMAAAPSALRCTAVSRRGHRSRVGVQLPAAAQRRLGPASGVCPKNGRVGAPQRRRGTGMSRSPPTSTSGSSAKTRRAPRTSLSRSCGGLSSAGRSSSALAFSWAEDRSAGTNTRPQALSQNAEAVGEPGHFTSVWPGRRLGGSRSVLGGCPWRQPRSAPRVAGSDCR